ncbi:MAG: hypothetical protein M1338_00050 [Patescibacteria group bacterium]|nr:hypothetical protein [Patescibacteria group bacterium]
MKNSTIVTNREVCGNHTTTQLPDGGRLSINIILTQKKINVDVANPYGIKGLLTTPIYAVQIVKEMEIPPRRMIHFSLTPKKHNCFSMGLNRHYS